MMKNKKDQSGMSAVVLQTVIVGVISLILIGVAQPVFMLLGKTGIFEYSVSRFAFGSIYGWILGVANFFAMGVSLFYITLGTKERKEGQLRARGFYSVRLIALVVLSVIGCVIPFFHPVSVLISIVLTQLSITAYALYFKAREAKAVLKQERALEHEEKHEMLNENEKPVLQDESEEDQETQGEKEL